MKKTLVSMAIGAGVMYLLDPEHGEERRNALVGKFSETLPKTRSAMQAKAGAIGAKAQTYTAKADEAAAEVIESAPPTAGSGESESGAG